MKIWNKLEHEKYTAVMYEPEMYVDNEARGRSGHISHALCEIAPDTIVDFNSNCSAVRFRGHSAFGWVEYRISIPEKMPEKHVKFAEIVKERYNLKVKKVTKKQIKKGGYGQKVFELANKTYCDLYGFSLLSPEQIDQFVDMYLGMADLRMFSFVENENDELIAFGLSIPSIAEALQKCNGEIFPFGWWHLLKSLFWKRSDTVELLLIGVRPDYQSKGVNAVIFCDLFETYTKLGFKYAETNANLESNAKVQAMWAAFDKEQHKKRWVFGKEI